MPQLRCLAMERQLTHVPCSFLKAQLTWLPTSASSLSLHGALPVRGSTKRRRQAVKLRSVGFSLQQKATGQVDMAAGDAQLGIHMTKLALGLPQSHLHESFARLG